MTRPYSEAELAAIRTALAPCPGVIGESWETRCERLLATLDVRKP
jgi:hypothetical protein